MARAVAINVGANTNLPGVRGPVYPDGSFEYVPIPERKPTAEPVPTYADLDFSTTLPPDARDAPVHFDPEFAGYAGRTAHTYGDEHGVKAGPLSRLAPGDSLLFYATLERRGREGGRSAPSETGGATRRTGREDAGGSGDGDGDDAFAPWIAPEWGAYLVGEFRVERVLTGAEYRDADPAVRARFATNAHVKRDPFDAEVLVAGGDGSRLFDRAVPLSARDAGATANRLVTGLSNDSGKGPWWRRVLRYDEAATAELRRVLDAALGDGDYAACFGE